MSTAAANRWGKKLAADVAAVMSRYPDADPDYVRLTLISLQSMPLERLNRSLRRGIGFAAFRNGPRVCDPQERGQTKRA
jgi:hypothetical protein